jgi:hypothetical protein
VSTELGEDHFSLPSSQHAREELLAGWTLKTKPFQPPHCGFQRSPIRKKKVAFIRPNVSKDLFYSILQFF